MDSQILQIATIWARYTKLSMDTAIQRTKAIDTGALRESVQFSLSQAANELQIDLSFADYGRFVDMGVGRGRGFASANFNKEASQRRAKKFYSKIVFNRLSTLRSIVSYSFAEKITQIGKL